MTGKIFTLAINKLTEHMRSKEILLANEMKWEQIGEGVFRQILGHDDSILMVKIKFEKDAIGAVHDHFHSQVTHILSGKFEFELEGKQDYITWR